MEAQDANILIQTDLATPLGSFVKLPLTARRHIVNN